MRNGFRQAMAWLCTWSGLLVGWVLFFIFLTGTTGYFDVEIDRWMQPERPLVHSGPDVAEAAAIGMKFLERRAPAAAQWTISPPGRRENPDLRVSWRDRPVNPDGRGRLRSAILDPLTGEAVRWRATGGGLRFVASAERSDDRSSPRSDAGPRRLGAGWFRSCGDGLRRCAGCDRVGDRQAVLRSANGARI